jgi:pimeloyl-ACP methyl ester carboxylesterase
MAATAKPLVLAAEGSFFVNGRTVVTDFPNANPTRVPGHIVIGQMYVQYRIPAKKARRAYPVVMVHGSAHTGMTYETTPDGREGWATYLVRKGIATYVVDHAGRGRSGFDATPVNQGRVENNAALVPGMTKFTNENAWTTFRFGPSFGVAHPTTAFPLAAADQYFAQLVPNSESTLVGAGTNTVNALVALLDQIGPAVVMVHSQSGSYGLRVAEARPNLVKALVSVEPTSCAITAGTLESVWARVPLLTVFGDFVPGDAFWEPRENQCRATADSINGVGGRAFDLSLPAAGFVGNSHMLMMDRNNLRVADWILGWLRRNAAR